MPAPHDGTPRQNLAFDGYKDRARAAPWPDLDALKKDVWRAWSAGDLTDEQASYVTDGIIAERQAWKNKPPAGRTPRDPDTYVGSRPRTRGSLTRRRQYIAIGLLPDRLLGGRAWGIYAVLAFVARKVIETGRCALTNGQIAAEIGYGESTVQAGLRYGKDMGVIRVEYRRPPNARFNLPNVVTILDAEWLAWLKARAVSWRRITKRGRAFWGMIGSKFVPTTCTRDHSSLGLSPEISAHGRPAAARGLSGMESARSGPAGPMRGVPG